MNATLFIPDISGFTQFVKTTEQVHSKHIIRELLEIIIARGREVFTVAEVEGDAVFFFREGETYPAQKLNELVRSIYQEFHAHLSDYEYKRICDCGACRTANDLRLKFIVHAGDIDLIELEDREKPFGEPVIAVHRLLKNGIPEKEYILYSCAFLKNNDVEANGTGIMEDDDLGKVEYKFASISDWYVQPSVKERMLNDPNVDLVISRKKLLNLPIHSLHTMLVDLQYRHYWNKGVDEIIYDPEEINKVGSSHRCIVQGKDLHFDTIRPEDGQASLSYGEVLKNPKPFKYFEVDYFLHEAADDKTDLTLVLHVNFVNVFHKLLSPIFQFFIKQQATRSLNSIESAIPDFKAKTGL